MRIPLVTTLRRLDRHFLLNNPVLWTMRIHWMLYFWLIGLALTCVVALTLPVSIKVLLGTKYHFPVLGQAVLVLSPWVYLQARFAPQLRQNSHYRSAIYLLGGYIFIVSFYLLWPYAFCYILERRAVKVYTISELQQDYAAISPYRDESIRSISDTPLSDENLHKRKGIIDSLCVKYECDSFPARTIFWNGSISYQRELQLEALTLSHIIDGLLSIKTAASKSRFFFDRDSALQIEFWISFHLVLALRIFQAVRVRDWLVTLFFVGTASVVLITSSSSLEDYVVPGILLLLFCAGGCSVLGMRPLPRKSVFSSLGINIFTLLLAWTPFLGVTFLKSAGFARLNVDLGAALLIGGALLFILTPWIQRNYLDLQSKPS